MKAVAAYVRMSTDHQKYSIANQMASIGRFCTANAMELVRIYTDAGRSGLTAARRPGLSALLADANGGQLPFSAVVVLDVSRFGRFQNVEEGAYLEHLLKRAGAPVLYCAEAFDNDGSPGSAIVKAVKRAMAAEYSRELSAKTAAGARRVAGDGWRACGAAGLGYRRVIVADDGRPLYQAERGEMKCLQGARTTLILGPDEEVAAIRRMFELYVSGRLSIRQVCRTLKIEGHPAPSPKGWSESVVGDLLQNEKYCGVSIYGKKVGGLSGRRRNADPADWVVVDHAVPAIVLKATFQAAQRLRQRNLHHHTPDQVVKALRRLFRQKQTVTRGLIDAAASLPSSTHVCKMFGSLQRAYEAAGLPEMSLSEKRAVTYARKRRKAARGRSRAPGPHSPKSKGT